MLRKRGRTVRGQGIAPDHATLTTADAWQADMDTISQLQAENRRLKAELAERDWQLRQARNAG